MTRLSPEGRFHRLLHIFERTGREGQWTRPFDKFPQTVRTTLREMANPTPEELPVLACFRDAGQWTLITTEQVVAYESGSLRRLPWRDIRDATVNTGSASAALASSLRGKLVLSRLKVVCRDGEALELELEPGPAFLGLWNVIKTLGNLGRE